MNNAEGYVKMVSDSMSVELTDDKIKKITHLLLDHKDYNKMLVHLENMIMFEKD